MGIALLALLFLLVCCHLFSVSLVLEPLYLLDRFGTFTLYLSISIGIVLVAWIVGE